MGFKQRGGDERSGDPDASESNLRRRHIRDQIAQNSIHRGDAKAISANGQVLDWLIDLRAIFMDPKMLAAMADEFWLLHRRRGRFQIGGIESAAIPLLTAILLRAPEEHRDINGFIIRKERKSTGLGKIIEGKLNDAPIVLIDDIINSASSAEKARSVIAADGRAVHGLFAVIDYESSRGLRWRQQENIEVTTLFKLQEFGLALKTNPKPLPQSYRRLWNVAVPGGSPLHVVPKSAPLLVGSMLYRGCDAGKMQAFDAGTGRIVWEYCVTGAPEGKGIWSSPAYHDGYIFFGAYNGVMYCLEAASGSVVWARAHGDWIGSSPVVVARHELVYIGIEYQRPWAQGGIAALDMTTGHKVWEHPVRKLQHGSAAYWHAGDLVIWGTADHVMAGLDAKTGKAAWTFKTRRSVKYAPAICEQRGLVAFASFDKSIYVLDAATGGKLGEWETGEICYTTPLFVGDRLFCGSGDRNLYVIDLSAMALTRKIPLGARAYSSPRFIDGNIVVGTSGGLVVEVNSGTLQIKGRLQLEDAVTNAVAATPDGSRIFVSTSMNHLYAFERH
ncbi:PQQ-binding-like beta-propeller repeat protein [Bradyrhizobium tropiciagri]|uniref:outer membrane protein assembly factor BamB family protein n=1 Tax=Bradyrhizobium tropiciagri TaxID=312253 RepID=UPI001BAD1ECB|nr:PQQ-binding-like beta-propeller repeat protein [Bradyrhizobium tropiciagri]